MLAACLAPCSVCGSESLLNNDENNAPSDLFGQFNKKDNDGMQEDKKGRFPPWLEDSEISLCFGCETKFSKTFRKHHCRRCRSIFCSACSSRKSHIVSLKTSKPVRVCDRCHEVLLEENIYLQYAFPLLQRGETFKLKQSGSFNIFRGSAKFVCLRLMSDELTLIYDDESSNEPVTIHPKIISHIVPSGFTSFDIVTESKTCKTHTFEAENASICKEWLSHLQHFVTNVRQQPLKEEVETERQVMKMKCAEMQSNRRGEEGSEEEESCLVLSPEEKRQKRNLQRQQLKDKYNL